MVHKNHIPAKMEFNFYRHIYFDFPGLYKLKK